MKNVDEVLSKMRIRNWLLDLVIWGLSVIFIRIVLVEWCESESLVRIGFIENGKRENGRNKNIYWGVCYKGKERDEVVDGSGSEIKRGFLLRWEKY